MDMQSLIIEAKKLENAKEYGKLLQLLIANKEDKPSNSDTCLLGVSALIGMGLFPQALDRAQNWLKTKEPNNVQLLRVSGALLDRLGKPKEALENLNLAEKIKSDQKTREKIAEIQKRTKSSSNHKPLPETPANTRRFKLATDWTDTLGYCLWCIQMLLIAIYLIVPYWSGIYNHPSLHVLEFITRTVQTIKLSTHAWWVLTLVGLTIVAGMFLQHQICQPKKTQVIEFSGTRKLYSFHWHWLFLLLTIAASLYTNTHQFNVTHKQDISSTLGVIAIAAGFYCLYLLLPGARPTVQLIRTVGNKGNRIVVFSGVIFQSIKTYLPQNIENAQIKRNPLWIFTFTSTVDIELDDGETLRLISPGSILETRLLPHKINEAINDAKIIGFHPVDNNLRR